MQGKEAFIHKFAAPAVEGFVRSISLSRGSSLQDTLRLLTLWFDYGQYTDVYDAIVSGLNRIEIDTWLQVIPQLIARIDTPRALVSILIHQLLMDIGKNHPQVCKNLKNKGQINLNSSIFFLVKTFNEPQCNCFLCDY